MKKQFLLVCGMFFFMSGFAQCPVITVQPQVYSTICENETFAINVFSSGTDLSYQWLLNGNPIPGQTFPVCAVLGVHAEDVGVYSCIVSKNGCPSAVSQDAMMVMMQEPQIVVQPVSVSVAEGGTFQLYVSATGSSLNYQWQHDGFDIPGANASLLLVETATFEDEGNYTCIVSNSSCPSAITIPANVSVEALGIENNDFENLKIFPNPADGVVHIEFGNAIGNFSLKIFDVFGKEILSQMTTQKDLMFNVSELQSGVYFVSMTSEGKSVIRKLIVK